MTPTPVLGNVVISKKFLRTRKIMVRVLSTYPRRPKRNRSHNIEEVVVRSPRDPTDPAPLLRTSEFLTHVQLGDAPRAPIQQSSRERVPSARRRGDDLDVLLSQGFA